MYTIDELFDIRVVVGNKLEQLIESKKLKKNAICAGAGISRPTLDKLICGEINSKVNFEKHISKLLGYLSITPNELMGTIENPFVDFRQLREIAKISMEELSEWSGVSVNDLKRLEAGESLPLKDLRDIALLLGTSVKGLLGQNYFQTTVATMDIFLDKHSDTIRSPGGFWGHVGILCEGMGKYEWYPISNYSRNSIYNSMNDDYIVIPCLDNTLLVVNNDYLQEIVFLDDACDPPEVLDWDYSVDSGEYPGVIYEAFEDYYDYISSKDNNSEEFGLSSKFCEYLDLFVSENKIDADDFNYRLSEMKITFSNKKTVSHLLRGELDDEIDDIVKSISETGSLMFGHCLKVTDYNEAEINVNMKKVSLIKLPRSKTEDIIFANQMILINEAEMEAICK